MSYDEFLLLATFESNIISFIPLISNEFEILVIPLLPYNNDYYKECIDNGNCREA